MSFHQGHKDRFLSSENNLESRLDIYHELIENAVLIRRECQRYPLQIEYPTWFITFCEPDELDEVLMWMKSVIDKEQGMTDNGPYR